jgi:nucleoside-triphosphatase
LRCDIFVVSYRTVRVPLTVLVLEGQLVMRWMKNSHRIINHHQHLEKIFTVFTPPQAQNYDGAMPTIPDGLTLSCRLTGPEWILVTGQPGCGKTTAVKTIVEFLQANGRTCRGFYTDEVLDPSTKRRIGFDVVRLPDGKRGILSRKAGHGVVSTRYKTGQYFVDVASFESIALPSLEPKPNPAAAVRGTEPMAAVGVRKLDATTGRSITTGNRVDDDEEEILVLDEIGRMELHSTAFSDRVRELLRIAGKDNNTNRRRLVGAITAPIYGHRVPFCDEVATRDGVEVHKLTKTTRDRVLREVLQSIRDKGWC